MSQYKSAILWITNAIPNQDLDVMIQSNVRDLVINTASNIKDKSQHKISTQNLNH